MFPSKFKEDSSKSPGFLFIRAYNNWHTHIKKILQPLELTHPQFVVLAVAAYLQNRGEKTITQAMIAAHSEIDPMTTSQILKLLEKKGLVKKEPHPSDTRANVIILLEAGIQKVSQSIHLIEEFDNNFFGLLHSDEPSFMESLKKLSMFRLNNST